MIDLRGKIAIVTGAASGIGRASATVLAQCGAHVVVADIDSAAAHSTAAHLCEQNLSAVSVAVDVSQEAQIQRMVATAVTEFGGVDILHNNAAAVSDPVVNARDRTVLEVDVEAFVHVLRINVIGYALGAKYTIPHMIERGGGVIINTASDAGHSSSGQVMYGTSKAAILGFTRNVAAHHGKQGIRCVSVSPGIIVTPALMRARTPEQIERSVTHNLINRAGKPEDIGHLVAFLASEEAGFITGVDVRADGGLLSHFPAMAEDMAAAANAGDANTA